MKLQEAAMRRVNRRIHKRMLIKCVRASVSYNWAWARAVCAALSDPKRTIEECFHFYLRYKFLAAEIFSSNYFSFFGFSTFQVPLLPFIVSSLLLFFEKLIFYFSISSFWLQWEGALNNFSCLHSLWMKRMLVPHARRNLHICWMHTNGLRVYSIEYTLVFVGEPKVVDSTLADWVQADQKISER